MEKISALIDKLQELKNTNAGLQTISYYTQLLQAEILHQRNVQKQQELRGNGHVAVIMPAHTPAYEKPAPPPAPPPEKAATPPAAEIPSAPLERTPPPAAADTAPPVRNPPPAEAPPAEKTTQHNGNGYAPDRVPVKEKPVAATLFDPPKPTPPPAKANSENGIRQELNELVGKHATSLNDAFRSQDKVEVGEKLSGMAVNDLKNAIGINDKFQFIQELFRGDKTMYERSIKTINEATSLQEAVYWIERELKIKLGWNESDHLVKHFYSLVRKRFS